MAEEFFTLFALQQTSLFTLSFLLSSLVSVCVWFGSLLQFWFDTGLK